jgi:hypothetical protein
MNRVHRIRITAFGAAILLACTVVIGPAVALASYPTIEGAPRHPACRLSTTPTPTFGVRRSS